MTASSRNILSAHLNKSGQFRYNRTSLALRQKKSEIMKKVRINSKNVEKGDIFIAISSNKITDHIEEAKRNGASLIFAEKLASNLEGVIGIEDARLLASKMARFIHSEQPEFCVAITGTNGKSSVAHFVRQFWTSSGRKAANLGTVGLFVDDDLTKTLDDICIPDLTTPDQFSLHQILEKLKSYEVNHFVFEASSHALQQKRLHSVSLSAAAFTNLESDHLDYHMTRDCYFKAKLKLFSEILDPKSPAVVSRDFDDVYNGVTKYNKNIISFGMNSKNCITIEKIRNNASSITFDLVLDGTKFKDIEVGLIGEFQLMNLMCSIGIAYCSGLDPHDIIEAMCKIRPLQGRMELIKETNGIKIFVDYAHTSSAFEAALSAFKNISKGKLICVFGCGGDRDKTKRREMGEIAGRLADVVVVTDDNPRSEDPATIREEIMLSCKKAIEIGDRKEAIKFSIRTALPGDHVVVMGKGHETTQAYGSSVLDHSDQKEILDN
ncbi:MAG: UDP-N-acetylmuramoyl-L-alanyl-D-glutamate--2,6-diaminopimelate ligase [Holosporales bacterium]|nr:UDP-N-acetylmuramoyl-L-alanyl-D-glutamate--2,6-diaminopimelate ligase [Holosporales bacterium]